MKPVTIGELQSLQKNNTSITSILRDVARNAEAAKDLNALQSLDSELLENPPAQNRTGKLSGIPFVAKDNINTNSLPTSGGTPALETHTPASNAPVIDKLLAEGAILVGKAGLHELAFGITSNNSAMGAIRNPHDPNRIPGGSSGGTAVAVATGIVPFGLGTDTGGSCRIPAALCGVVGFRPSTHRYSAEGVIPLSHTRDTVGPFANNVEDIILIDEILAGDETPIMPQPLNEIHLGVDQSVLTQNFDSETAHCFAKTLKKLADAGVTIVDIDLSKIWEHNKAFSFPVVLYEVMRDLPNYLAKYAPNVSFEELIAEIRSPDVEGVIKSQLGDGAMPAEAYEAAINIHKPKMSEIYADATAGLDAIIFPTTPLRASKIGEDETVNLNGEMVPTFPTFIRNTDLGSNLGVPGISIPAKTAGLPIGIELDGKIGEDKKLLALASALENIIRR